MNTSHICEGPDQGVPLSHLVKSAVRTCQILTLVGAAKDGLRHGDVSKALNIPTSSLSGLLSSLVSCDFLSFDPSRQRYSIGPGILSLAGTYLDSLDIVENSRPIVHKLAEESGESVAVAVRAGTEGMIVCKRDSAQPIRRTIQIGQRSPLYATASGKILLAYAPEQDLQQYLSYTKLSPVTRRTIVDIDALRTELAEVRRSGFAYNREESADHIVAVAAPILDVRGNVSAAIVVSLPVTRFSAQEERRLRELLQEAATRLSGTLGFRTIDPRQVGGGDSGADAQRSGERV